MATQSVRNGRLERLGTSMEIGTRSSGPAFDTAEHHNKYNMIAAIGFLMRLCRLIGM
jgi:hypothetical protein